MDRPPSGIALDDPATVAALHRFRRRELWLKLVAVALAVVSGAAALLIGGEGWIVPVVIGGSFAILLAYYAVRFARLGSRVEGVLASSPWRAAEYRCGREVVAYGNVRQIHAVMAIDGPAAGAETVVRLTPPDRYEEFPDGAQGRVWVAGELDAGAVVAAPGPGRLYEAIAPRDELERADWRRSTRGRN